jgi:hypothetical protein
MFAMARGERLEAIAIRVPIMSRQHIPRCSRHWYPAVGYLIRYFSRENLVAALRVWRLRDDSGERSAHRRRWDGLMRGLTWRRLRSL